MENTPDKKVEQAQEIQDPGRRRLLKILAASGVVAAAGMVPSKYTSPALKTGVLPAHAQTTPSPEDQFTIVANDANWDVSIVGEETHFQFEAAAFANGVPLENVDLAGQVEAGVQSPVNIEPTGANGVADFLITIITNNIVGQPVATIRFVDQATYGNASDTIIFNV